ncbi:MAG: FAD-dependent oxidoreductase [Firmicutes bacterium HGW-Firmicutes-15]|nr:MAG: FAD-dependent oxidoreductase [Firmicutes bacterium HGW-Firmicutes-15]
MAEEKFTAIIVGAGPAGSTAAYLLAQEGLDVLLIERGETPGSKNMFGGRMYSYALNQVIPGFWEEAPLQRPVVKETVSFMSGKRSVSMTCQDQNWLQTPVHSFTLLRAEFDAWLANKAEEAGAMLACGIRVDDVLIESGRVTGVRAGEDEIHADVVIAADGANSLLTERAGLRKALLPGQVATGAKQLIELSADTISQRFQLEDKQGAAYLYVGSCSSGMQGGGFLYTNLDSISLGLVVNVADLQRNQYKINELLEDFKSQPQIAPLIAGGQVAEYSAHLVPEAGFNMRPELFGDGILVVGDAAGFVINLGYQVRGMDLAIASGAAAARTVMQARAGNDFSEQGLSQYPDFLKQNGVWDTMEAYRHTPLFLDTRRLYEAYPQVVTDLAADAFTVDGSPPEHLLGKMMRGVKSSSIKWSQLAGDAWKGGRSL